MAPARSEHTPSPITAPRLEFVDGMRALAALFVVLIHVFYEPSLGLYSEKWMYLFGVSYQRVPVDVFIVLSGFCLMLPIARRDSNSPTWATWFKRRVLRILPPYYAALALSFVLSVVVIGPLAAAEDSYLATYHAMSPLQALVPATLQLQDVFGGIDVLQALNNAPLWSIAVELKVYLFMPLVLLSLRAIGAWWTLLWTVAFGLGAQELFGAYIGAASPWYVALFTMGAIAAQRSTTGQVRAWWRPVALALVVLFGVLVAVKHADFYNAHLPLFGLLVGAATSLFVGSVMRGVMAGKHSRAAAVLGCKPLATIGVFSYSLYLIHNPLIRLAHLVIGVFVTLSPLEMFAVLLALTPVYLAIAYAFHLAVERPFMSGGARQRTASARPDRAPAAGQPVEAAA